MDRFQYNQGRLHCEQVPVEEIARKAGTPLYLYSHNTLRDHYRQVKEAFRPVRAPQPAESSEQRNPGTPLELDWVREVRVNTSAAESKLTTAKSALIVAGAKIPGLIDQIETAIASATPAQSFRALKDDIKALSDEIRAVHRQLVEVITLLKNAIALRDNNQ